MYVYNAPFHQPNTAMMATNISLDNSSLEYLFVKTMKDGGVFVKSVLLQFFIYFHI